MQHPDICIAGAGIIGLSLALELHRRGIRVTVLDQSSPLSEASTAAAGMLAAHDPHNPPQLQPLADLSLSLYPAFLDRLCDLSGIRVPFQTHTTLQALPPSAPPTVGTLTSGDLAHLLPALNPGDHRFILLDEHSLDPRQLATALLAAVRTTTIDLRPNTPVLSTRSIDNTVEIHTPPASSTQNNSSTAPEPGPRPPPASPTSRSRRKRDRCSPSPCHPRFHCNSSSALPTSISSPAPPAPTPAAPSSEQPSKTPASTKPSTPPTSPTCAPSPPTLLPPLADAPQLEAWAGLRPATPDGLPLLGALPALPNHFIATGHYRDGILLAPATAHVMAQLLSGESPSIDLHPSSNSQMPEST